MKILLINPPIPLTCFNTEEYYLPSSLLYLASVLQRNGEEVKILDMKALKPNKLDNRQNFYETTLIDTVTNFQPALIGLGGLYSGNFPDVLNFSILCKENLEKTPVVIGGIHPTLYPVDILTNCHSIDWIILGEGEQSILQLVNTIKSNRYQMDRIDGFAYRLNGKVVVNPKRHYIDEPDSIPFPAYKLINLRDYYVETANWHNPKKLPINTSIPIISSRSCPKQCPFCSMYMVMGPRWRPRSPQNVVDEIEYLYYTYNHRHFSFMDDNFSLSKSRVLEICQRINKRKLNIQFETPNGLNINTLDKEMLDALVQAGLVRIFLAIESGSDFIRNTVMRKNLSREKILEVIRLTKEYPQLYVSTFFIIGMPEETRQTLIDTYNMIREINVDKFFVQNIAPFPGTKVFEQALKDRLFVDIDIKSVYKTGALSITKTKRYFIKPYRLDLKDLDEFRDKCDRLAAEQKLNKLEQQKVG